MTSSAQTIREARKRLRLTFKDMKWEDARGRRFEKQFWQPLDEILTTTLGALEEMERELARIKQQAP